MFIEELKIPYSLFFKIVFVFGIAYTILSPILATFFILLSVFYYMSYVIFFMSIECENISKKIQKEKQLKKYEDDYELYRKIFE